MIFFCQLAKEFMMKKMLLALLLLGPITLFAAPANSNAPMPYRSSPIQGKIGRLHTAPPSIQIQAPSWVLMAYPSGQVLSGKDIHQRRAPASLAKLMTSYVLSNAVSHGTIHLQEPILISTKAWKTGGSKMFIKPGEAITVGDLMQGMIVQSGNDATVALSQFLAGSEDAFVGVMSHTAKQLGMKNTVFKNANGLPADGQHSSAYDIALLARAFIHNFPAVYKLYSQKSFTWNGITQNNRNKLLYSNPLVDGMKTGYTNAAGYNLVTSAIKDDQRVISVVLGTPSAQVRTDDSNKLITYGFRFFTTETLYSQGDIIKNLPVANAENSDQKVGLYTTQPITLTIPKGSQAYIRPSIKLNTSLEAPIIKGEVLGTVTLSLNGNILASAPIAANQTISKAGYFTRMGNKVKGWF